MATRDQYIENSAAKPTLGQPLSRQEERVVRLLTHDDMDAQTAARTLGIAEETVKSYIKRAHSKTGCVSRSQLTKWALANQLATIEGHVVLPIEEI